ncbi:MAG: type IV pilus modification PilV family protein [Elusimicrobiota bacterium]
MRLSPAAGAAGMSMVEIIIGLVLLAMVGLGMARLLRFTSVQSVRTQNKAFAAEKASQMMEELRSLVESSGAAGISVLDDYDDGTANKPVLTTESSVTDPAHPLSGNNGLLYERRITVRKLAEEPLARRVHVRVYAAKGREPLAETVSVLRTIAAVFPPSQTYDIYAVAIPNCLSLGMGSLDIPQSMLQSVVNAVKARNPGLRYRVHVINRLAYGRDPYYTPYTNTLPAQTNALPSAYVYVGHTANQAYHYVPSLFDGRVSIDGTIPNIGAYTMADMYNHAVRYPDEVKEYTERYNSAPAGNKPEKSLRMILEEMNSQPGLHRNAILVSLHGPSIPLPPMRNYSDPAKDPAGRPDVRVVTHPERLSYGASEPVKLRVYSYVTRPDSYGHNTPLAVPITVKISRPIAAGNISVRKLSGYGGGVTGYSWGPAVGPAGGALDYDVATTAGETAIILKNSPLRHGANLGGQGLQASADARLYDLEYIPAHMEALMPGTTHFREGVRDLADAALGAPKNTARWVITIPGSQFSTTGETLIETWIGDGIADPATRADPKPNLSRTYTWVGAANPPPVTEQYQFLGDPRHMPYSDVKRDGGYNWYFRGFNGTMAANYPGFDKVPASPVEGWANVNVAGSFGYLNFDFPRYLQIYRNAFMRANAVYNNSWTLAFYAHLGGEHFLSTSFGPKILAHPWNQLGLLENINELSGLISGSTIADEYYPRVPSRTDHSWWGLYWLGELYPDGQFPAWSTPGNPQYGNLPTGLGNFYRATYSNFGFPGTMNRVSYDAGAAGFFNGNASADDATFVYVPHKPGARAQSLPLGQTIALDFKFALSNTVLGSRPMSLTADVSLGSSGVHARPPEWMDPVYQGQRTRVNTIETYYEADPAYVNTAEYDASSLLSMQPGAGGNSGYVCHMGFDAELNTVLKQTLITAVRGFQRAGADDIATTKITQIPRVKISSPGLGDEFDNPTSITVAWDVGWLRWDGRAYTTNYSPGWTPSPAVPLTYNIKYSSDRGQTWKFVQTGLPAEQGVRSNANAVAGGPYAWNVAAFPRGHYIVAVEAYRDGLPLHYASHWMDVYIQR